MRYRSNFFKYFFAILFVLIGLFLAIYGAIIAHECFVLEFNKQLEVFGYYKEDIHMLDLSNRIILSSCLLSFGVIFTLLGCLFVLYDLFNYYLEKRAG